MLNQCLNSKGLLFTVNYNGHDLHFEEWKATDDVIYYLPLSTLVDNGYGHRKRSMPYVWRWDTTEFCCYSSSRTLQYSCL